MSRSAEIALTVHARGVFNEGTLDGAIYPGMIAEVVPGGAVVGGRPTWRAFTGTPGDKAPLIVVLPDFLQGRTKNKEYADGERVFLYSPARGDEINFRFDEPDAAGTGTGTGFGFQAGDYLRIGAGGYLEETSDPTEAVAQVTEEVTWESVSEGTVQAIVL